MKLVTEIGEQPELRSGDRISFHTVTIDGAIVPDGVDESGQETLVMVVQPALRLDPQP